MSDITIVGLDLAKNVFQVHAENEQGEKVLNKQFSRKKFREYITNLPPCLVGMEACGTAHYWAREVIAMGHRVKLVNPRKVKAFVERNKNDAKDAEAVCDATRSKKVRGIPVKSLAQQDLTMMHRARSQLVRRRTQLVNHLRSQLAEYGLITKRGFAALECLVKAILAGEHLEPSQELSFVLVDQHEEWLKLNQRIKAHDAQIRRVAKTNKTAQKLLDMPGIGEITATALVAKVEDFNVFKTGRNFSAWLGLTPKESSSAQRRQLGKISKQGDRYLRTLLIHGARTVIMTTLKKDKRENAYHRWIHHLVNRIGKNKAVVALANKHARMIWAVVKHGRTVDLNFSGSLS